MILIGLGANLPSLRHGPPRATLEGALTVTAQEKEVPCGGEYKAMIV